VTYLFDPRAAIQLALAGEAPSGWNVLKADISYWKALRVAFSDTSVVLGRVLVFSICVVLYFLLKYLFTMPDESIYFLPLLPFFLLSDMFSYPIIYFLRERRAKHSFLLLTPSGFLQSWDIRKPTFQGRAYAYAEIASIKITYRSHFETALQFIPSHGKATLWTCPYWYGPTEQIAQNIIDAHAQYQALNNHPDAHREK
jgi:hypothetical protein